MNKDTTGKKEIVGKVVSVATIDTVIVEVSRLWRHPIYKKAVRRKIRIAADVREMELHVGEAVRLVSTRPISKTKQYKVVGKV